MIVRHKNCKIAPDIKMFSRYQIFGISKHCLDINIMDAKKIIEKNDRWTSEW